ncbi:biotin--[acetyl-CoA-carboxylase] ligase [Sporosarcina limicola]|uniref:Bifunctional ligase/repressor BirA n=1 Tax=Sporosarcina limicola TaxID=34101 RepID=A0A927MG82_9BACL|nr:biotin--[acetyl-CoA-carboxylase] ligase [Sporosarcina limicola]MBE1554134.1 BirA family biotin operon repressor/biotin-[acetyl-CoA-carboxylase] ligase [Sporosarcina limicola]
MNSIVKNELLKRLFEAEGEPVSGQEIADHYGLSRTAIWKYVKELEEEGYEIGTIRKKGYFLIKSPDRVNEANVQKYLTTKNYGKYIRYFETCSSTQIIAHEEAQNGALDGTVIISEEQTAGKGRMARPWSSVSGKGIWMSIIIRPTLTPQQAPQMTLVAAVAVTRAIQEMTGIDADIKWPNDILIGGKKITGILTELQSDPDQVKAIILGIGMNVNQDEEDFPDELHAIATSLKRVVGNPIDRAQLIAKILGFLELYTEMYEKHGFGPIKILWEGFSNTTGKRIRAVMLNETIVGTALGISNEGVLELKLDDGSIRGIYSADITISK